MKDNLNLDNILRDLEEQRRITREMRKTEEERQLKTSLNHLIHPPRQLVWARLISACLVSCIICSLIAAASLIIAFFWQVGSALFNSFFG